MRAGPGFRSALGAIAFFCLAPGTVAGLLPFLISGWRQAGDWPWPIRAAGALLVVVGLLSLVESFARFVIRGHGTPAPVAPPTSLVITGQYRHSRNPMYVALIAIVAGQGSWLGSGALFAYAALLWFVFHLRVVLYEEPTLAQQFGAAYAQYRLGVSRWMPRFSAWRPDGSVEGRAAGAADQASGSQVHTLIRTVGLLVLMGVAFLVYELGSAAWEFRALEIHDGGWLDLSTAAFQAKWLYWAGHVWAIAFLRWRTHVAGGAQPGDWFLFASVVSGIVAVHALVLGPLREWIITPWLF